MKDQTVLTALHQEKNQWKFCCACVQSWANFTEERSRLHRPNNGRPTDLQSGFGITPDRRCVALTISSKPETKSFWWKTTHQGECWIFCTEGQRPQTDWAVQHLNLHAHQIDSFTGAHQPESRPTSFSSVASAHSSTLKPELLEFESFRAGSVIFFCTLFSDTNAPVPNCFDNWL